MSTPSADQPQCRERPASRIALLVTDSVFAFELARPLFAAFGDRISLVVLSRSTSGSARKVIRLASTTSWRYFAYRSFVEIASRLGSNRRSVRALAKTIGTPIVYSRQINSDRELERLRAYSADIGVALNFDQILSERALRAFGRGVINAHASKLPAGRGIAPALWAFARGDSTVWVSLYQMDKGLDTGPLFEQFPIDVLETDTALTMYLRVCETAGSHLVELLNTIHSRTPTAQPTDSSGRGEYSWPDRTFSDCLRRSRRRLLGAGDVARLLFR